MTYSTSNLFNTSYSHHNLHLNSHFHFHQKQKNRVHAIPGLFCSHGCWSLHIFLRLTHVPPAGRNARFIQLQYIICSLAYIIQSNFISIAFIHSSISIVLGSYNTYSANDSFVSPPFFNVVLVKSKSHTHRGVLVPPISVTVSIAFSYY
jgi:hypothetical protein